MKKTALIAALAGCISGSASAASPYDGIWENFNNNSYWVVNTAANGTDMLMISLVNLPINGVGIYFGNGQAFQPTSLDVGNISSGTLRGNTFTGSGPIAFRACAGTLSGTFTSTTTVQIHLNTIQQSVAGAAQRINCAQLVGFSNGVGPTITLNKVF